MLNAEELSAKKEAIVDEVATDRSVNEIRGHTVGGLCERNYGLDVGVGVSA